MCAVTFTVHPVAVLFKDSTGLTCLVAPIMEVHVCAILVRGMFHRNKIKVLSHGIVSTSLGGDGYSAVSRGDRRACDGMAGGGAGTGTRLSDH